MHGRAGTASPQLLCSWALPGHRWPLAHDLCHSPVETFLGAGEYEGCYVPQ